MKPMGDGSGRGCAEGSRPATPLPGSVTTTPADGALIVYPDRRGVRA